MIEALLAIWLTGMAPIWALEEAEDPRLSHAERFSVYWLWPIWIWFMDRRHWAVLTGWGDKR